MTIRYRVITIKDTDLFIEKEIVAENLDEEEAQTVVAMLQDQHPKQKYDIEEYNWAPNAKRLGRDPDLH